MDPRLARDFLFALTRNPSAIMAWDAPKSWLATGLDRRRFQLDAKLLLTAAMELVILFLFSLSFQRQGANIALPPSFTVQSMAA